LKTFVLIAEKGNMVERKALVVGINDYPLCPLKGCCNDSESIKDLLSNHGNGDPNFSIWKKDNVATKLYPLSRTF
jgi:hypothetical protein